MKKCLPCVASIVLGLLFIMASVMFFLHLGPKPDFPEGAPIAHFMAAFGPTGYMNFVKMFELVGGIVVMIPRLRNLGLLLLGPGIVNILAFHFLITGPASLLDAKHMWMLYVIVLCALYLLWDARKKFAGLLN
jgi:putative oxidoreductase